MAHFRSVIINCILVLSVEQKRVVLRVSSSKCMCFCVYVCVLGRGAGYVVIYSFCLREVGGRNCR